MQVLLLVEARLQFDHRRDRLPRLGGRDQGRDDRRLVAGPVKGLLDRDDRGIGRRLANEIDHHLEAFVRVMDDEFLFANGREAIAVVLQHPFGIARRVRRELELRAVLVDDRHQPGDAQQPAALGHHRVPQAEMLAKHGFGFGVELAVQFEQDDPPPPAALNGAAEEANEVFRLLLDLDVAVAQDPKDAVAVDAEPGKDQPREAADHALDRHVRRLRAGHPHEPRHSRRHEHHFDQPRPVGAASEIEQHAHAQVGNEGERMRGIDRLGREHRKHIVDEELPQPLARLAVNRIRIGDADPLGRQLLAQFFEHPLLPSFQAAHLAVDFG